MIKTDNGSLLVLAVFPSTRGFGYVLFEGPRMLVDWGFKHVRTKDKNQENLRKFLELLNQCAPDILVLENYRGEGSRRNARIEGLIDAMAQAAKAREMETQTFSRADIRWCFALSASFNKYEIAVEIANRFPELEQILPPPRKIWEGENVRVNVFDAASLALTYFATRESGAKAA